MGELYYPEPIDLAGAEAIVEENIGGFVAAGRALSIIRSNRWWKGAYESWEDYLRVRWDISTRRARYLIAAVRDGDSAQKLVAADVKPKESHVRVLNAVPEDKREAVIERAEVATNGKVTAKALEEAAKEVKAEEPVEVYDRVGYQVTEPTAIQAFLKADVLRVIQRQIQQAVGAVKMAAGTPVGKFLNLQAVLSDLHRAKAAVKAAEPYSVCVYCDAKGTQGCTACKRQRWLTKSLYDAAPDEYKEG